MKQRSNNEKGREEQIDHDQTTLQVENEHVYNHRQTSSAQNLHNAHNGNRVARSAMAFRESSWQI